jgi:DNA-binding response OmpR family regulator
MGEPPAALARSRVAVLLYGEEHANLALAEKLALDGLEVRRASHPAMVPGRRASGTIRLVIFARASRRGGLDVLRGLRAGEFAPDIDPMVRTLWMSSSGGLPDVLRAFESEADDVLRAPFAYPELLARACALLRRDDLATGARLIEYDGLRIDTAAHEATFAATPVCLRRMEYALLVHLAHDPRRVYTKDELLRDVWNFRSTTTTTRTVDSHACRLRRKLAHAGANGWVTAIWGIGYRLAPCSRPTHHGQDTSHVPAPTRAT